MTRAPDGNNGQDESISALLAQLSHGKREVEERLIPPINEAWVRLVEQPEGNWQNRVHFFGVASLPMRQILVDHARMRADKRGGMQQRMTLGEPLLSAENNSIDILALQEAMERLKERDWQMARVWLGDELSKTP